MDRLRIPSGQAAFTARSFSRGWRAPGLGFAHRANAQSTVNFIAENCRPVVGDADHRPGSVSRPGERVLGTACVVELALRVVVQYQQPQPGSFRSVRLTIASPSQR